MKKIVSPNVSEEMRDYLMDAKEYLIKINLICHNFQMRCDDCPLEALYCGYPANKYDIDQAIEVVEKYDIPNEETVKWEDA